MNSIKVHLTSIQKSLMLEALKSDNCGFCGKKRNYRFALIADPHITERSYLKVAVLCRDCHKAIKECITNLKRK